jgi:hypothetical protein
VLLLFDCNFGNEGAKRIGLTLKSNSHLERLDLCEHLWCNIITEEGYKALAEGLSSNVTLLELELEGNDDDLPAVLQSKMNVYLDANNFRMQYLSREPASPSPLLLSLILDRVSIHPAVLYFFVREHIPGLLASASAM